MNSIHFAIVRIILGIYLFIHFISLFPYSEELFSNCGIFVNSEVLPAAKVFGNILSLLSGCWASQLIVVILILASLLLVLGWQRRFVAFILWLGWAYLLARNPFISNPALPFIGLILLVYSIIPGYEPFRIRILSKSFETEPEFYFPKFLWIGIWILMALSYSISGVHKLNSPSWMDGTALSHLINNPLSRVSCFTDLLRVLPVALLSGLTWGALVLEVLFAPLALFGVTRIYVWAAMVLMHLGILAVVDFADLTAAMLILHAFTFDSTWLLSKKRPVTMELVNPESRTLVFFDGDCGLCNSFIQILFKIDVHGIFLVSSLQGIVAQKLVPEKYRSELSSIVVRLPNAKIITRSDAILAIATELGGLYSIACLAYLVPRILRNIIYNFVARNRHRFRLSANVCERPTPELAKRIIP